MNLRWLCVALFVTTACAPGLVRPGADVFTVTPVTMAGVHHGINDGFHGPLPEEIVQHYYDYGGELTIRTPHLTADSLMAFRRSLHGSTIPASSPSRLSVLALIEGPDVALASAIARDWLVDDVWPVTAIENGNELELPPHNLIPQQYANAQAAMMHAEGLTGFRGDLIMGGVYALTDGDDGTKHAIMLAAPYCRAVAHCLVGVHLYAITREDIDFLNALDLDIAITETGSPTGCGAAKWQEQADYVAGIRAMASQIKRLKYFIVYQRPSGPTCSDLDTFGIMTTAPAGSAFETWKPLDDLLAQWVKR